MADGRRADTARRRERVLKALNDDDHRHGEEVTVSGIARHAGIDRTFLYRHRDLLEQVHAAEAEPPSTPGSGPDGQPGITAGRPARRAATRQPAHREDPATRETPIRTTSASKPGASPDSARPPTSTNSSSGSSTSNNTAVDLRLQLEERDQDLAAARAANRELMTRLNAPQHAR